MKKASIRRAILMPALTVLSIGMILLTVAVAALSSNTTQTLTDELISARVKEYASEFDSYNRDIYGALAAITPVMATYGGADFVNTDNPRDDAVDMLAQVLFSSDKITAIWTCWEPDAFDGRDADFAGQPLYGESGRYAPCLYREGDGYRVAPLTNYDDPVLGDYYQGALLSGRPHATDPYIHNGSRIYSLAMPIVADGAVRGVVGVDVDLSGLIDLVSAGSILEDGYLYVLSPGGLVAAHPDASILMTRYDATWMADYRAEVESAFARGDSFAVSAYSDITQAKMDFLGSGVAIGDTGRHWLVCGVVPEHTVNAAATSLILTIAVTGLVLIAAVGLTIRMIIRRQLRELPGLTALSERMAVGDLDAANLDTGEGETQNEITLLIRAFQNMAAGLRQQAEVAARIGRGDYAMTVPIRSEKDIVCKAINQMLDSTNELLGQISGTATGVSAASRQLTQGAQALASGATEQAATMQQLQSAIGQIADKTEENAALAEQAAQHTRTIKQSSQKGSGQMDQMILAVSEIKAASDAIATIMKAIDDIAFQTNILALNAAVEAARAGQYGKGFAVVAEEVRRLAAKSAEAARATGDLVRNSIEKVDTGFAIAESTAASLSEILLGIDQIVAIIGHIAEASGEQTNAVSEINLGIAQVAEIAQQNNTTAEELACASGAMRSQAEVLQTLTERFRLRGTGGQSETQAVEVPAIPAPDYTSPEEKYAVGTFGSL